MEFLVIGLAALIGSGLTLFSGFGLGTIMVPVFALFFPLDMAILLTAIVHFLNNCFKLILLGKNANWQVILRFGIPAIVFAYLGAEVLKRIEHLPEITHYSIQQHTFEITWVKVIIGLLLILFAIIELVSSSSKWQVDRKYLPFGGILSGFFGGLSGHQGALRSIFLLRSGLSKEGFIATGVVIACMVDVARLTNYIPEIIKNGNELHYSLLIFTTLTAFTGVWLGNKLVKKVTIRFLQLLVSVLLIVFGITMMAGII